MKVKALRGVCIGVDRHLKLDDTADLEPALVTFLVSIGAVAPVPDESPATTETDPAQEQGSATPEAPSADSVTKTETESPPNSMPNKPGKKEK